MSAEPYGEGYWERGEGSNYHGYGDDPGWTKIAGALRMRVPEKARVMELGCASGYFVSWARKLGLNCTGVDVSGYALSKAPASVRAHVFHAPATGMATAKPDQFHAVVSWEMLEHLTRDEITETIGGIWTALKPGGVMWHKIALGTDGKPGYEQYPFHDAEADATHVSLWLPEEWRDVFDWHGFLRDRLSEDRLNQLFTDRDWHNRFFCYVKPVV